MKTWYVTTEAGTAKPMTDADEISAAVSTVRSGESEFFVVEPEPESETSFIQASTWTRGVILGRSYVMELRVPAPEGYKHYRVRTKRFEDIESAVSRYLAGRAPESGVWTDVTDEFVDDVTDD